MKSTFNRLIRGIQSFVGRKWYVPLTALLAGVNSFLLVFPIDLLLITRFLFKREGWIRTIALVALGSALGGVLLAAFINWDFPIAHQFIENSNSHTLGFWSGAAQFVQRHGTLGVAIAALSFVPLQFTVVSAALTRIPLPAILIGIWIGRGLKYFIFAMICFYAPHWLPKKERRPNRFNS